MKEHVIFHFKQCQFVPNNDLDEKNSENCMYVCMCVNMYAPNVCVCMYSMNVCVFKYVCIYACMYT